MPSSSRAQYMREWRAGLHPPKPLEPCGTYGAWSRHRRNGELPCGPCRVAANEYSRAWRERHPEYQPYTPKQMRDKKLERLYGLSPSQVSELFEASDGLCYLCYDRVATDIDHDHQTGEARGAACKPCNRSLGTLGDTVEAIEGVLEALTAAA